MNVDIQMKPGCSVAVVSLQPGESFTSEAGAMIAMSHDVGISTSTYTRNSGGIMSGLKRMLSGESFFINQFTAGNQGGEVFLAPTLQGDMMIKELDGDKLIVQSGSYLASESDINIDFNWQGFKSLFSGENLFWLNINGRGKVIINAYGVITRIDVDGEYIVDSGHIVAFEPTLHFEISKAGKSWFSSFLGGEGFVCRFKGKGSLWCQSHNPKSFGGAIGPALKPS